MKSRVHDAWAVGDVMKKYPVSLEAVCIGAETSDFFESMIRNKFQRAGFRVCSTKTEKMLSMHVDIMLFSIGVLGDGRTKVP